jgi:hypothetical protein
MRSACYSNGTSVVSGTPHLAVCMYLACACLNGQCTVVAHACIYTHCKSCEHSVNQGRTSMCVFCSMSGTSFAAMMTSFGTTARRGGLSIASSSPVSNANDRPGAISVPKSVVCTSKQQ